MSHTPRNRIGTVAERLVWAAGHQPSERAAVAAVLHELSELQGNETNCLRPGELEAMSQYLKGTDALEYYNDDPGGYERCMIYRDKQESHSNE